MTLDQLLDEAAKVALAERDRIRFTPISNRKGGTNDWRVWTVGPRKRVITEFPGTKEDCIAFREKHVLQVVFGWLADNCRDSPNFMNDVRDCWAPAHAMSVFKALAGEVAV